MVKLATDLESLSAFIEDAEKSMASAHLSKEEREILTSGDTGRIYLALTDQGGQSASATPAAQQPAPAQPPAGTPYAAQPGVAQGTWPYGAQSTPGYYYGYPGWPYGTQPSWTGTAGCPPSQPAAGSAQPGGLTPDSPAAASAQASPPAAATVSGSHAKPRRSRKSKSTEAKSASPKTTNG